MAELEAITDIKPTKDKPHLPARVYGRRFPLANSRPVRLGRDEAKVDFAVPEDDQISKFQAVLEWDPAAERLAVTTRPAMPPEYPGPPANDTEVYDPQSRQVARVAGGRCVVGPGGSFYIGQTRFTVRRDGDAAPESPVDATVAPRREERTRAQLDAIPFTDKDAALKALSQLPATIRAAANEQGLFRRMLRVVVEALPRAAAAAVVRIPPGAGPNDLRLTVVESCVRSADLVGPVGFAPSRKLCHQALGKAQKQTHLHFWSTDPNDSLSPAESGNGADMTLAVLHDRHLTPWAVCAPIQDGGRTALYLAGHVPGPWNSLGKDAQDRIVADLTEYQKVADLVVGMVEATLQVGRLSRQNEVIRRAWPRNTWKYLDDPDKLEGLLRPAEREVTVLFCDLRDYSLFASKHAADLLGAQREVAVSLNTMSSTITDRDGVVAGFRGDAVLGFWGWPDPHGKQVESAARSALAIQGRLTDWSHRGRCGLGLTHGPAVVGRLGAHDLAVVDLYGPGVNLAFRLEAMTKAFGVGIIVTDAIADGVAAADPDGREFRTRPLGRVKAKGFPDPVPAHELYSAHAATLNEWQQRAWPVAVGLFTAGEWADAADKLNEACPDDPAAQCLLRAMDRLGRGPDKRQPPADWDGSFRPTGPDEG